MSARRCETCGRFVPKYHLATIRRYYDIDRSLPVSVYSEATATKLQIRLDCSNCSMECCLMTEAARGHGTAIGRHLPNGWVRVASTATQADWEPIENPWAAA